MTGDVWYMWRKMEFIRRLCPLGVSTLELYNRLVTPAIRQPDLYLCIASGYFKYSYMPIVRR